MPFRRASTSRPSIPTTRRRICTTAKDRVTAATFARSLKNTNYLVTETNAQTIGWDSRTQFPPYDGQLRQDVYLMAATGANMVEYWHWHSLHYGQETYWKGVLSHDLEPGRAYAEVARTAHELQRIGTRNRRSEGVASGGAALQQRFAARHRVHAVPACRSRRATCRGAVRAGTTWRCGGCTGRSTV